MEVSNEAFLVRLTQIYQYSPDAVRLGAQFVYAQRAGAHRITILTTQDKLTFEPRIGQQWEIANELNHVIRQQSIPGHPNKYLHHWQFMEPKLKCVMPDSGRGFVEFVSKDKKLFPGIGPVHAQTLWDAFSNHLFATLEQDPDAPYEHDKSISNFEALRAVLLSDERVRTLYKGMSAFNNLKYASQFVEWEIEEPIQRQLFRFADKDATTFLKENPYRLFSLGMRFHKVDAIAQKHFNVASQDERRLTAIVEEALRQWSDKGHTLAEWDDIKPTIRKLLNNDLQLVEKAQELKGDIIGFTKQDDKYFVSGNFIFEKTIAKRFTKLRNIKRHWLDEHEQAYNAIIPEGWVLEKAQEKAIRRALTSYVFALSGGAGTGKTTTTRFIVDIYRQLGYTIYPAALSGKAARRLQQSIGIKTSTIARLLKEKNIDGNNCVLLIDEASMVDAYTMWRLVTLFPDRARIILVGDPHQLPPINAGFVLNDAIKSGVINHVELDVVRRTGVNSTVPAYSKAIRDGVLPKCLSTADIHFQEPAVNVVEDAVQAYKNYESAMVVAPTNATVRIVNERLQEEINPNGDKLDLTGMPVTKGNYTFKKGDPIVITLTRYVDDVQNGMLGKIISVDANEEHACTVELEDVDNDGNSRVLNIDWDLFEYVELAYCLTLHKLQGSQAKNVIVLLERGQLLDRSWLYTAVTRAEDKVRIIGQKSDFEYAVYRKGASDLRKTGLVEMLINE